MVKPPPAVSGSSGVPAGGHRSVSDTLEKERVIVMVRGVKRNGRLEVGLSVGADQKWWEKSFSWNLPIY